MLRISKLTDYGIVLLARFAAAPRDAQLSAREMAEASALPLPVVSKMLKELASAGLLESLRGAKGGYRLVRVPEAITVAEIVRALEGPIALMECTAGPGHCEQEARCTVQEPWHRINRAVNDALSRVTLADLARPLVAKPLLGIENSAAPASHPNN
ncbi:MAG TPA: SUF system Fe-S cluster assembly regulator [Myxococcota bacterium]|jgi:FeS assembly SUF system regulator